jgi:HemY protein
MFCSLGVFYMRRFIWILIILIFSVWLGLQISKDPGLAFFSYRHWSVEMPLWFAILSFFVVFIIFYSMVRFFDQIDMSTHRFKNWLIWRRKNKSYSKTNRGLIEILEGHWKEAEYYLKEGLTQSDAPLLNYLALAKAAHEQKAFDRCDMYLRKAHAASPQADVAIGLTQAQLQLNQGQLEQALATLNHLQHAAPGHAFVLKLLERVYVHLGDWKNLLKLLPLLYKAKIINRDQLMQLELKAYNELLQLTASRSDALMILDETWQSVPRKLQANPLLIHSYASQLMHYSDRLDQAEELIFKTLKKSWHSELARLYGLIVTADSKKQLARAEQLLKQYDKQAMLLLTLGRLTMRCQLWGKARAYFEESLHLEAHPETYVEYAKLLEKLGDSTAALRCYQDGLLTFLQSPAKV